MKKNKTIMDIVFDDLSVKVFYSNGEVEVLFCDEVTDYIYSIAKDEMKDLNIQEKKQIYYYQTALMLMFITAISLTTQESVLSSETVPAYITEINTFLKTTTVTYVSATTLKALSTYLKKRNIVKTLKFIREILKTANAFDFKPTFLEKIKLSDSTNEFDKSFLEEKISSNISIDSIDKILEKWSKKSIYDEVIILENNEMGESSNKILMIKDKKTY